jgi:hypothetical protein
MVEHEDMPEEPAAVSEAAAWAALCGAWDDEAAHRAYLARLIDLDGFAAAGGRYSAVLSERPGDAMALRFREEVVKRATATALASLPRTSAPRELPRAVRWFLAAAALSFGGAVAWAVFRLFAMLVGERS